MDKPTLLRHDSTGEPVFGTRVNPLRMEQWDATVVQMRDVCLSYKIVGPDFTLALDCHPDAKEFVPNQAEVEHINELCHDASIAGRVVDFGLLPNDVLKFGGNRGGPLWQLGGLGQPFEEPWILYHTWEHGVGIYLVNPHPSGDVEMCELQPTIAEGDRVLIIMDRGIFLQKSDLPIQPKKYLATVAPASCRFVVDEKAALEINVGGSPAAAAAGNIGDPLMTALIILNTRNIDRETVRVSDKLQKARRKNGKPPIPPFDRVHTVGYVTAIQSRGHRRDRSEDQGGTHASPVPHLRMGHPRNYATGNTIFIKDTLVNVPLEQRKMFKSARSHYTAQR
jgi:hypothetical protein